MMSPRRPRRMKNRVMSSGPRKKLNPMSAVEKVGRLKEAIKRIEEYEQRRKPN